MLHLDPAPDLGKAKKQAAVTCASDMRQVHQAFIQYAGDFRDRMPNIAPGSGVSATPQFATCISRSPATASPTGRSGRF